MSEINKKEIEISTKIINIIHEIDDFSNLLKNQYIENITIKDENKIIEINKQFNELLENYNKFFNSYVKLTLLEKI
ncbi:MAG: hypothetical protein DA328_06820 [Nitrososphaeraceae archaeon]|nr:hypothetical protein [Nitrososphaeraceae archaeon]